MLNLGLIILAVIGALAIISVLGMWLMHATMMAGMMGGGGINMALYVLFLIHLIFGIGFAVYLLIRRGRRSNKPVS